MNFDELFNVCCKTPYCGDLRKFLLFWISAIDTHFIWPKYLFQSNLEKKESEIEIPLGIMSDVRLPQSLMLVKKKSWTNRVQLGVRVL